MVIIGAMLTAAGFAGVIWIAIIAIQNGDVGMGIVSLFCGIVALIYGVQNLEQCKIPLGLMALGVVGQVVVVAGGAG